MTWQQLREEIAETEHNVWMKWAKFILDNEKVSTKRQKRWSTFFVKYKNLPDEEKDKDRKQADKIIRIIKKHVTF